MRAHTDTKGEKPMQFDSAFDENLTERLTAGSLQVEYSSHESMTPTNCADG